MSLNGIACNAASLNDPSIFSTKFGEFSRRKYPFSHFIFYNRWDNFSTRRLKRKKSEIDSLKKFKNKNRYIVDKRGYVRTSLKYYEWKILELAKFDNDSCIRNVIRYRVSRHVRIRLFDVYHYSHVRLKARRVLKSKTLWKIISKF